MKEKEQCGAKYSPPPQRIYTKLTQKVGEILENTSSKSGQKVKVRRGGTSIVLSTCLTWLPLPLHCTKSVPEVLSPCAWIFLGIWPKKLATKINNTPKKTHINTPKTGRSH